MLKKWIRPFLFLFILYGLQAQELPSILVGKIENRTGQKQYDVIGNTVSETLVQTLRLTGVFEVSVMDEEDTPLETEENLRLYARDKQFDNLVSGEIELDSWGDLAFTLSLYDPIDDELTTTVEETAEGILNVFDTSDELILDLLSSFSDRHWEFSGIILTNQGIESPYTVYLNNIPMGESLTSIDKALTGEYLLKIRQLRFGNQTTVYEEEITIAEGETLEVTFAIPDLLPEEQKELNTTYDRVVRNYKDESAVEEIQRNLLVLSYLETFPFQSEKVKFELSRFRDIKDHWLIKKEWWQMEENSTAVTMENIRETLRIFEGIDPEKELVTYRGALLNGKLCCALLRMQAIRAFKEKDLSRGYTLFETIKSLTDRFGSVSGFGYADEYAEIQEIRSQQDWSDGKKRRKCLNVLDENKTLYLKFLKESRHHKLLVLSDFYIEKARINHSFSKVKLPYLDNNYRPGTVRIEGGKIEPVGKTTIYYIPDWDQDARYLAGNPRIIDPFEWTITATYAEREFIGCGFLWRFANGQFGIRSGLALYHYDIALVDEEGVETGEDKMITTLGIPLEVDWFFLRKEKLDLYTGIITDVPMSEELNGGSLGINLGAAYVGKWQTFFLETRLYLTAQNSFDLSNSIHIGMRF